MIYVKNKERVVLWLKNDYMNFLCKKRDLLSMTGLGSIFIIITLFVKRLCVPLKILICSLAISLTPALLVIIVPNEFALFGSVVGMLVLFMLWADKQFMALPKELCVIDKSLQTAYPKWVLT